MLELLSEYALGMKNKPIVPNIRLLWSFSIWQTSRMLWHAVDDDPETASTQANSMAERKDSEVHMEPVAGATPT
jgi:hypothetical protein